MSYITPGTIVALLCIAYASPSLVAVVRGRRQQWGVVALNLLLGWTLVGWVAAMGWAVQAKAEPSKRVIHADDNLDVPPVRDEAAKPLQTKSWDDEDSARDYEDWLANGEGLSGQRL